MHEYDVVVAGGGTAGLVAAIAAARHGARTVLIEKKGCVGGLAVEGGTAAALCAGDDISTRALPYRRLRSALEADGVYFETSASAS